MDQSTLELFNADIRYCPSIEPFCYEDTSPKILPRRIYDGGSYFMWGYYNAIGDHEFVGRMMQPGNKVQSYTSVWTGNRNDYFKPYREGNWSAGAAKYTGGTYYQTYDTMPLVTDFITTTVISHKPGSPKIPDAATRFYASVPSPCRMYRRQFIVDGRPRRMASVSESEPLLRYHLCRFF